MEADSQRWDVARRSRVHFARSENVVAGVHDGRGMGEGELGDQARKDQIVAARIGTLHLMPTPIGVYPGIVDSSTPLDVRTSLTPEGAQWSDRPQRRGYADKQESKQR